MPFSQKILLSSQKLLNEKTFKTSFLIKKVTSIFVARRPLLFKRDLPPKIVFHFFLGKCHFFWKMLLVVVRNSIDTFWYRWVSIPYLGIDTSYCHWNSDQEWGTEKKSPVWQIMVWLLGFVKFVLVVQNSIDTLQYRWVSIPYLGIDTRYCHWNSDQKCPPKKKFLMK